MTNKEFVEHLKSEVSVHCMRQAGGVINILSVYTYNGWYSLHWEECREENYRSRQDYLRREVITFGSPEEALDYVTSCGYLVSEFNTIGELEKG